MPYRPSLSQIRSNARARAAQIHTRARQAIADNQRHMEQRIRSLTANGARPLTRPQMEQLARESASYVRNRMR